MSLISRITTWTIGQVLKAADLNGEFNNVVNLLNNIDAGTTNFNNCNSTTSTITTLTATTLNQAIVRYRRPRLLYSSGTVVNLETGINGTSGQAQVLFPDGTLRTDSTAGRINFNIAQNAVLSGSAQSGLRTSLSQTANTWYQLYAVKVTDSSTNFVVVGDTLGPTQANYATLNTNFGTNGWVYLGLVRNGDNNGSTNVILTFYQSGNQTILMNQGSSSGRAFLLSGTVLATSGNAAGLSYTYASGTGTTQIPSHLNIVRYTCGARGGSGLREISDTNQIADYLRVNGITGLAGQVWSSAVDGININGVAADILDICLTGWIDPVLSMGGNPL